MAGASAIRDPRSAIRALPTFGGRLGEASLPRLFSGAGLWLLSGAAGRSFQETVKLPELYFWRDSDFRSPAANMALDEALFHWSSAEGRAVARFYHWDGPAMTSGYFDRSTGIAESDSSTLATRRFTGGGLGEHGEDLTFLLTFPAGSAAARANGMARYRWIHETVADALLAAAYRVTLLSGEANALTGPCFANPVPWDLLDSRTGIKIGGGAQRRSRGAIIHQGSIRLPEALRNPEAPWITNLLEHLADTPLPLDEEVREKARSLSNDLEKTRYGNPLWNGGALSKREN